MAKGELTRLRCIRVADLLRDALEDTEGRMKVTADVGENEVTIELGSAVIVVKPVSVRES